MIVSITNCPGVTSKPPLPIWRESEKSILLQAGNERAFLTEDLQQLVLLLHRPGDPSKHLELRTVRLENDLLPQVSLDIKKKDSVYLYEYSLMNQAGARNPIYGFHIVAPAVLYETKPKFIFAGDGAAPWVGMTANAIVAQQRELRGLPNGRFITFAAETDSAIEPGASLTGLRRLGSDGAFVE